MAIRPLVATVGAVTACDRSADDRSVRERIAVWWAVLRPLAAREEGLAAGTGLLTGRVVERSVPDVVACPTCAAAAVVEVVDLVDKLARFTCTRCAHRWNVSTRSLQHHR